MICKLCDTDQKSMCEPTTRLSAMCEPTTRLSAMCEPTTGLSAMCEPTTETGFGGMCKECMKHTTEAQQNEFARINEDFEWTHEHGYKHDHLGRMIHATNMLLGSAPTLPLVVLLHIFLMLTRVFKPCEEYLNASMNFLSAITSDAEPRVFLNYLRVHAPSHHKVWHDFLMLAKYSPYLRQTIPDCFGHVCHVSPDRNPQIAKEYLDGTGPDAAYKSYRQETTIAICSCSHQTMCETEDTCIAFDMPADGNCNIIHTDATDRNYIVDDWGHPDEKQSLVDEFTIGFFNKAESAYQKRFLHELRYQVWLQTTRNDDAEPTCEHIKPDTKRVARETTRMRLEKANQKNSRRSRQSRFGAKKGSNTNKTKSRRDINIR